jgi:uncharacterized membrane protein YdbT with pleckstrin-like domain
MAATKPIRTVYRHIKTAIHISILAILLLAPLLFTPLIWLVVALEVLLLLVLLYFIVIDITQYIVLEDHCINVHTGLFFQRNNRLPYTKMNNIDITSFFGFHNLEIDAGNDVSLIRFDWIQDAHMLKAALDEKLMVNNYYQNSQKNESQQSQNQNSYLQQPHVQTNQEHMDKNIQELNQLAYLRSKGVITAQEFEQQKRKILNN